MDLECFSVAGNGSIGKCLDVEIPSGLENIIMLAGDNVRETYSISEV